MADWDEYMALSKERDLAEDTMTAAYDAYMRAKGRFDRLDRQANNMFRKMMDCRGAAPAGPNR